MNASDRQPDAGGLADALDRMAGRVGHRRHELYQRSVQRLSTGRDRRGREQWSQRGWEVGSAARLDAGGSNGVAFAAMSGWARDVAEPLADTLVQSHGATTDSRLLWPQHGERLTDIDPVERLPDLADLRDWLDAAIAAVESDVDGLLDARVELALVDERWSTSDGATAHRRRLLATARAVPTTSGYLGPLCIYGRSWSALQPSAWAALAADRVWPGAVGAEEPAETSAGALPWVVSPEAAAPLLQLAAGQMLQGVDGSIGPGWQIVDDPGAEAAVGAGQFDDAARRIEAMGWAEAGRLLDRPLGVARRDSYREVPKLAPAHLTVRPTEVGFPERAWLIQRVDLQPFEPGHWGIEADAGPLRDGRPAGPRRRIWRRFQHGELLQACVGTTGSARAVWPGVTTPGLILEWQRSRD